MNAPNVGEEWHAFSSETLSAHSLPRMSEEDGLRTYDLNIGPGRQDTTYYMAKSEREETRETPSCSKND